MSKKVNFSLKNEEFLELEKSAKKQGIKPIELLRKRYEKGKKREDFSKKILNLENKINKIVENMACVNESVLSLSNSVAVSLKMIASQTSIAHDYSIMTLKSILGDELKFDDVRESMLNNSKKVSENILSNFFEKSEKN